jgi:hypothetical protein
VDPSTTNLITNEIVPIERVSLRELAELTTPTTNGGRRP